MPASVEAPTRWRRRGAPERRNDRTDSLRAAQPRSGPLLAVCGLVGGAGATSLAYLVGLATARQSTEPVLVADTGGPSGGLAALAGVGAPRSLPELASEVAAGGALRDGLYATGPAGIRVLASGPEFSSGCPREQLDTILADAREAHGHHGDRLRDARPRSRPRRRGRRHSHRVGISGDRAGRQP